MENEKDFKKVNAIIAVLTEQRNNALNQIVALQVELIGIKEELEALKKNSQSSPEA